MKPRTLQRFPRKLQYSRFGRWGRGLPGGHGVRSGHRQAIGQVGDQSQIIAAIGRGGTGAFHDVRDEPERASTLHTAPSFFEKNERAMIS